jgi:PilZ domain
MASPRERRTNRRIAATPTVLAVVVHGRDLHAGLRIPGRLVDLGPGGASFVAAAPLRPGDVVRLSVTIAPRAATIAQDAVVLRQDGREDGTSVTACRFVEPQGWLADAVARAA